MQTYKIYQNFLNGVEECSQTLPSQIKINRGVYIIPTGEPSHQNPNILSVIHDRPNKNPDIRPQLYKKLEELHLNKDSIYMGAAGFANLDMIGRLHSPAALLFDINANQQAMWGYIFEAVRQSPDRHKAAEKIKSPPAWLLEVGIDTIHPIREVKDEKLVEKKSTAEIWAQCIDVMLQDPYSWLGNDDSYNHIHNLVQANAMKAITLDVLDDKGWDKLASFMKRKYQLHQIPEPEVGFCYMSNILWYFRADIHSTDHAKRPLEGNKQLHQALRNIGKVLGDESIVISAMHEELGEILKPYIPERPKDYDEYYEYSFDTACAPYALLCKNHGLDRSKVRLV